MIAQILKSALKAVQVGESFAIATVIRAEGSSPGKPGHKMIIYADGRQEGTAGGGQLELRVKQEALEMIRRGCGGVLNYSFDPDAPNSMGMTCGGSVTIAVEVVLPRMRILLCGAGHVAQALARQFSMLGFGHSVVDAREELALAERFPDAAEIVQEAPPRYIERTGLGRYSHVVVLTHEHALDRETLLAVSRVDFDGYIGMIGSVRKWETTMKALREAGVQQAWIDSVHCPIGLEIGAHTPAEIAVSIVAEILREAHAQH
ncbi:MAG: XdhC family protein [Candidatus Eisenbacteria sp.]|nr:XdhC family protein [Candidatus Eisenbacteria bacterium]